MSRDIARRIALEAACVQKHAERQQAQDSEAQLCMSQAVV